MYYSEIPAPAPLRHAIKLAWTLELDGEASGTVPHVATPDGCMELIHRLRGWSSWGGKQPRQFVAGVITEPATLQLGGGSRFIGVRIWPWAWNFIGTVPAACLVDRWADLREVAPGIAIPDTAEGALEMMAGQFGAALPDVLFEAILRSRSVADIATRSGRSHRWLQRWFERQVGIAPRTYLRLLRFSDTFGALPGADGSLADHAAQHGFADQAHMSREFRSMAGASAKAARQSAVGPFLSGTGKRTSGG